MTPPSAPPEPARRAHAPARQRAGRWRRAALRAGAGAASLLAAAALAQPAAAAVALEPPTCDSLARQGASTEELLKHLQRCQTSAPFLAHLGRQFNAQQRYLEAAEHLERAILFDPDDSVHQMDYAIALAGSGDTLSALQLMGALLARPDLPEPQRASLLAARARWAQAATASLRQTRLHAGLRMGYDNNLLGAPNLTSLTLTFPGETISLPLDGSNLPKPGTYLRADARLDHTRVNPGGSRWDISVGLLQRRSHSVPEAGSQQAEAVAEYSQGGQPEAAGPLAGAGHYLGASAAALDTRGGTRYHSLGVAAGAQWQTPAPDAGACQWRLGGEAQQRELASNRLLSGRYAGLLAQWACSAPGAATQWRLALRAGRDLPAQAQRPGGAQSEYSLRAMVSRPVGSASAWLLEGELSHTRDTTGYSPLLDNGARRRLHRLALRTEVQHTLRPGLDLLLGAELVNQQANLPLFNLRSQGIYIGLRGNW